LLSRAERFLGLSVAGLRFANSRRNDLYLVYEFREATLAAQEHPRCLNLMRS